MRKFGIIILFVLLTAMLAPFSASALVALDNLPNPGFEDGLTGWTLTNKAGDKVVCEGDTNHEDRTGLCAFLFKGNADSRATLKVSALPDFITNTNQNLLSNPGGLTYGLWRYSRSEQTKLNIKLTVTTTGDTIVNKITARGATAFVPDAYEWWQAQWNFSIAEDTVVTDIVLKLTDRSTAGKQWIDDAYLYFTF